MNKFTQITTILDEITKHKNNQSKVQELFDQILSITVNEFPTPTVCIEHTNRTTGNKFKDKHLKYIPPLKFSEYSDEAKKEFRVVNQILHTNKSIALGTEELKHIIYVDLDSMPESIWPLTVVRYIVRDLALSAPIDFETLENFKSYHKKYGWITLMSGAYESDTHPELYTGNPSGNLQDYTYVDGQWLSNGKKIILE